MRIVLFGTGNVATRLGTAFKSANIEIVQVFSRSEAGAARLSGILGCPHTTSKTEVEADADFYIIAVTDEAISDVISGVKISKQIVVHTSGSVQMDILSSFSENYGVLYPLQTLSVQKETDLGQVPFCIESNSQASLDKLRELASSVSKNVVCMDSPRRRQIHLAAVFVCNFVNHFYSIGESLLKDQPTDFELLKPLIRETASNAIHFSPSMVQTGPAVRGNNAVMEKHLEMLKDYPEWQLFYELISKDISLHHN